MLPPHQHPSSAPHIRSPQMPNSHLLSIFPRSPSPGLCSPPALGQLRPPGTMGLTLGFIAKFPIPVPAGVGRRGGRTVIPGTSWLLLLGGRGGRRRKAWLLPARASLSGVGNLSPTPETDITAAGGPGVAVGKGWAGGRFLLSRAGLGSRERELQDPGDREGRKAGIPGTPVPQDQALGGTRGGPGEDQKRDPGPCRHQRETERATGIFTPGKRTSHRGGAQRQHHLPQECPPSCWHP